MPVRDKAVELIRRHVYDGVSMHFNSAQMTATVDGVTMSRDEWDERYWNPLDEIFEKVVDSIDWNRVFLEATQRHMELEHEEHPYYNMICEECLNEALLAGSTHPSWKRQPNAERRFGDDNDQA